MKLRSSLPIVAAAAIILSALFLSGNYLAGKAGPMDPSGKGQDPNAPLGPSGNLQDPQGQTANQVSQSPSTGQINVSGLVLYKTSETSFVLSDGKGAYNVTMDGSTRAVNARGDLLGGSQFVSRAIMTTSVPITVTGAADGSVIEARTILFETTAESHDFTG